MALGHAAWTETRLRLQELLSVNNAEIKGNQALFNKWVHIANKQALDRWLSARLWQLQCISNGVTSLVLSYEDSIWYEKKAGWKKNHKQIGQNILIISSM